MANKKARKAYLDIVRLYVRELKVCTENCTLAGEWSSTIASINRTLDNTDRLVSCVDHTTTADVDSNVLIACTGKDNIAIVELV